MNLRIWNEDCICGAKGHLPDGSVDVGIHDPPFGIGEGAFGRMYNRQGSAVLEGYVEAPSDYATFTIAWMSEAIRVLKPSGSMYVVSGWSKLRDILNAAEHLGLHELRHIIWKYNFGCFTQRKFVTSHYHILQYCRSPRQSAFDDVTALAQASLEPEAFESVWNIKREFHREKKNANKLPERLIERMLILSSRKGDVVCDFFIGNFTTARVALQCGREPVGFELNRESYDHHMRGLLVVDATNAVTVEPNS